MRVTSPESQERFITTLAEYVYAVIDEAFDRANRHVRCVEDFSRLTRLTAGWCPAFLGAEAIPMTPWRIPRCSSVSP